MALVSADCEEVLEQTSCWTVLLFEKSLVLFSKTGSK